MKRTLAILPLLALATACADAATPLAVMNYIKSTATVGVITQHASSVGWSTPNRLLYTGL